MEHMPIAILLFYSIPESILLITISSALYGYDVKVNFKKILFLSTLLALTTYLVRALPIDLGTNALIQLPIFIFLTHYLLKVPVKNAIIIILTGFIVIAITESLFLYLLSLLGYDPKQLFLQSRSEISSIFLLFLLIPTLFIVTKHITLTKTFNVFRKGPDNSKLILISIVILLQIFFTGILQTFTVYFDHMIWPLPFNKTVLNTLIGFALVIIPIISAFYLRRLFISAEHEATAIAQEAFIDNINSLSATVKGQRHDFDNHLLVLDGLMTMQRYNAAHQYLQDLVKEAHEVKEILSLDNLPITALLRSKQAVAVAKNITLTVNISCTLRDPKIRTFDLVKIVGNLLDNAMAASAMESKPYRWVMLQIYKESDHYVIKVNNPRPLISSETMTKIFTQGFSTKVSTDSGQGLYIVKKLIEKNNGTIEVISDEQNGTNFIVRLPI